MHYADLVLSIVGSISVWFYTEVWCNIWCNTGIYTGLWVLSQV